jgi:hypothetical protein
MNPANTQPTTTQDEGAGTQAEKDEGKEELAIDQKSQAGAAADTPEQLEAATSSGAGREEMLEEMEPAYSHPNHRTGVLSPDHLLIDDEFPDEGKEDWLGELSKSEVIRTFVHNPKFLLAKVSRFCLDCRGVNVICDDEHFWPKKVDTLVHALEGMAVCCKIDLRSAFHNLVLDEDSRDMTSFQTPFGKYRYTRTAMGFKNALHTYAVQISFRTIGGPSISDYIL